MKKVLAQYQRLETNMHNYLAVNQTIKIEYASIEDVNILNQLMSSHSSGAIEVTKVKLKDISANLLQKKYDFAISFDSEFFDEPQIDTMSLSKGNYMIGVAYDHPLAQYDQVDLKQVYNYPLVMLDSNTIGKSYQVMAQRSMDIGLVPKIKGRVQDIESEVFLIKQEQLIGFFSETEVSSMATNGIKLISINDSPHKYQIVMAWMRNNLSNQQADFIKAMRLATTL